MDWRPLLRIRRGERWAYSAADATASSRSSCRPSSSPATSTSALGSACHTDRHSRTSDTGDTSDPSDPSDPGDAGRARCTRSRRASGSAFNGETAVADDHSQGSHGEDSGRVAEAGQGSWIGSRQEEAGQVS